MGPEPGKNPQPKGTDTRKLSLGRKAKLGNGNGLNGNGKAVKDAAWKIVTSLTLLGVLGVFTLLWNLNAQLAVIEATMVTDHELTEQLRELDIPPQWFRDQVERIDENLQDHMRETGTAAHRGGS